MDKAPSKGIDFFFYTLNLSRVLQMFLKSILRCLFTVVFKYLLQVSKMDLNRWPYITKTFIFQLFLYLFCIHVERPCFPCMQSETQHRSRRGVNMNQEAGCRSCLQLQNQAFPRTHPTGRPALERRRPGRRCLPPAWAGGSQALVFLASGQAHMEVYEYFLKGFRSKLVFPSAFSKAC